MLDETAAVPSVRGVMLTFGDFVISMEQFGTRIRPLMKCRSNPAGRLIKLLVKGFAADPIKQERDR
jgi:hypothetical protein